MNAHRWFCTLLLALIAGGCIVNDQITTLTIHPDGSADLVIFQSNIRSTETGAKGDAEIRDYRTRFEARTQDEFARINACGGRIITASWVRDQVPMANIVHATLPTAETIERLGTWKEDDSSSSVSTRLVTSGVGRRLTVRISIAPDQISSAEVDGDPSRNQRLARAAGISELRIALSRGKITDARGFTVAADGQSCLLDLDQVEALVREGKGNAELFLAWDVAD